MQITNDTQLNLVIGYPLHHSQSPLLHNTVYQHVGINAIMLARQHEELKTLIHTIKILSVELTAVTMPFKEEILSYLDDCSFEVAILKTANTVIQRNGKLYGDNTDIAGIAFAFSNTDLHEKQTLIIGAGGTARTIGYFLKTHKSKIFWINRDMHKAAKLAEEFGGNIITYDKLNKINPEIIINTTPVGLYPQINKSPLPDYIFNEKQIVFDVVYNPVLTKLLKQAKKNQAKIISGLDMFVGQGVKQIELLTNRKLNDPSLIDKLKNLLAQKQRELYI